MRQLQVKCDVCGASPPTPGRPGTSAPPTTWWTLEDGGHPTRTGVMDFCSLAHLEQWVRDPRVRAALPLDFESREGV